MQSFAETLEEFRKEKLINKKDLARRANLTPGYITLLISGKKTAPSEKTINALANALELDKAARTKLFASAGLSYQVILPHQEAPSIPAQAISREKHKNGSSREDWGEAPPVRIFYGRNDALAELETWIVEDNCQLVGILGMGGIGKTLLAAKLARHIKDEFEYVFWRSLRNTPPLETILGECIQLLSHQRATDLPEREDVRIASFMKFLQERRCLIVLDNFETVLGSGDRAGRYQDRYEGYGKLLQYVGEYQHKSCLLLTSREKPKEFPRLEGKALAVRSMQLAGMEKEAGQQILKDEGLDVSDEAWRQLIALYSGNPLVLKLVSEPIRELFQGNIAMFLREGEPVFGDIRDFLRQQFARLSEKEWEILYWLAIEREMVTLDDLSKDLLGPFSKGELLTVLASLQRRSMIEASGSAHFMLQPVILEYVTNEFVEHIYQEIDTGKVKLLQTHALIKAQARDYERESQIRHILEPIATWLLDTLGREGSEKKLRGVLSLLREAYIQKPGYAAGNLLNLFIQLQCDLRGYNFSQLTIWQAYLQDATLPEVNFASADLERSVFADTFGSILSVALSANGELLAAGTAYGEVRLWQAATGKPLHTYQGHTDWVRSVTFSPDSNMVASGSHDRTVRVWDVNTDQCLHVLQGHTSRVYSVAFDPTGQLLASGSDDQTVRLWKVSTGEALHVLQEHNDRVYSVAFHPGGKLLASGSNDATVRLWNVQTGSCLHILRGHLQRIYSLAFSPDGSTLASGSNDATVRLWEVETGRCLHILQEHSSRIRSVAFHPLGKLLASGSDDQTIRLWDVHSGHCVRVISSNESLVWSVAFSPDGGMLASGSGDQTVRLWEMPTGRSLKTLRGYDSLIWSVAFRPDGQVLASGSEDQKVCIWEVGTGRCLTTLQAQSGRVRSVAFSPDGSVLASGSDDQVIRLWELNTGQCLHMLRGHESRVRSVAFSPDGSVLASGSDDHSVRLWETNTGQCLKVFQGHTSRVYSVVFNASGTLLASSGEDETIRLWEIGADYCPTILKGHRGRVYSVVFNASGTLLASSGEDETIHLWKVSTGESLCTFYGHNARVQSMSFSQDGTLLASGGDDQIVRLWDVKTGQCLKALEGHNRRICSVMVSPDGKLVASGSHDATMKLWDMQTGECQQTLRSDRPYERMNIRDVKGLTLAHKATLKALGAIEV